MRRLAGIGYQLPPSSGMAEPDGPSVSLNGVVVALVVRRNQIDLCAINSAVAPPCSVTG